MGRSSTISEGPPEGTPREMVTLRPHRAKASRLAGPQNHPDGTAAARISTVSLTNGFTRVVIDEVARNACLDVDLGKLVLPNQLLAVITRPRAYEPAQVHRFVSGCLWGERGCETLRIRMRGRVRPCGARSVASTVCLGALHIHLRYPEPSAGRNSRR